MIKLIDTCNSALLDLASHRTKGTILTVAFLEQPRPTFLLKFCKSLIFCQK